MGPVIGLALSTDGTLCASISTDQTAKVRPEMCEEGMCEGNEESLNRAIRGGRGEAPFDPAAMLAELQYMYFRCHWAPPCIATMAH